MSVIEIRKAQREKARLVIGLAGPSGEGKTVTAILLAYGLANYDASKVGFLDTENRRGSLNADILADPKVCSKPTNEPFLIADLYPPFSPDRYVESIHAFQEAGVEVLIIDSTSHEWEGTGGCTDIAELGNPKVKRWNIAKPLHRKFMSAALESDMHIIFCVRARNKSKPKAPGEGTGFTDLGMQPIQEKNFMFEMTVALMMADQGRTQTSLKVPAALQPVMGRNQGYVGAADGKALRDWVDGGKQLDPKVESWRNRLISQAEQGLDHTKECWGKVPAAIQTSLGEGFQKQLYSSATAYDEMRATAAREGEFGDGSGGEADEATDDAIMAAAASGERADALTRTSEVAGDVTALGAETPKATAPAVEATPAPTPARAAPPETPKAAAKVAPAPAPETEDVF